MSSLERFLGIYLDSLVREGGRLAKIKSLSIGLEILKGLRRVTLSYFYAFIACLLFTASLFSALVYNLNRYNTINYVEWDLFNVVVLATGGLALVFLLWSLNEKRWIRAFNIDQQLLSLASQQKKTYDDSKSILDEDKLKKLIEDALDKKLSKLVDEKLKSDQKFDQKDKEEETQVHGNA